MLRFGAKQIYLCPYGDKQHAYTICSCYMSAGFQIYEVTVSQQEQAKSIGWLAVASLT
jgi:hypothetical protein